ncbi:MAG: 4Fe-4S binding protein [candidate division KSB1 bacterium]|nr:4Fe-4S binding protein [candidate division KSB1 bacterium]
MKRFKQKQAKWVYFHETKSDQREHRHPGVFPDNRYDAVANSGHLFFLFNFAYIGVAASAGELIFGLLPREKKVIGRRVSQLLIGSYMLGVLGILGWENMQIEGFFIYLLAGIFSGPVLHYLIAKIGGTFLFGRGWCEQHCPMDIKLLSYMRRGQRIRSTECIACQQCVNICPENAVQYSKKFDPGFREYLNYRKTNFPQ